LVADVVQFLLQNKPVYGGVGQAEKKTDSPIKQEVCITKGVLHFFLGAFDSGGIRHAPMGGHRLRGPHRAHLRGCVIADP